MHHESLTQDSVIMKGRFLFDLGEGRDFVYMDRPVVITHTVNDEELKFLSVQAAGRIGITTRSRFDGPATSQI